MLRVLTLLLCLTASAAAAETITYELYELSGGARTKLLAHGTKSYTLDDIAVTTSAVGTKFWRKELLVADGFSIGASIYRDKELDGFGLWLTRRPEWYEVWSDGGFSWDWFYREQGATYRKLEGPGRLKATIVTGPRYEELTAVEFLEDVTFRLKDSPWFSFSDADTHHMVVRKGSVFRVAP